MTCSVETCDRETYRNGYCLAHNARLMRNGDVMASKPIQARAKNGEPLKWLMEHVNHGGDECLIWPFYRDDKGYAAIVWDGMSRTAARLMCAEAHGKPPQPDMESAHSCGQGHEGCIHPGHLRWATKKENGEDKSAHGRSLRGEKSYLAKLTEDQVLAVKRRLAAGERQSEIAADLGVSHQLISAINTGHCWSWLKEAA